MGGGGGGGTYIIINYDKKVLQVAMCTHAQGITFLKLDRQAGNSINVQVYKWPAQYFHASVTKFSLKVAWLPASQTGIL